MQQIIQQTVDILIVVMGGILCLFMLALLVVHMVTSTEERHVKRLKERVFRYISSVAHIEFLRNRVYSFLDPEGEVASLREIRGLRTRRGVQVLEMVAREVDGKQREALRFAVCEDWYRKYILSHLSARSGGTSVLITKLIAELAIPDYTDFIVRNLLRSAKNADAQQIGMLALFVTGQEDALIRLFTDDSFKLILSFRTLYELFHSYGGNRSSLYRRLLTNANDVYVRRACIHGIGANNCVELSEMILPNLYASNANVLIETVRAMGKLLYGPAKDRIYELMRGESWALRTAAIDALIRLDPEHCYDALFLCLQDKVWWVRFHAAEALMQLPCRARLLDDVRNSGDRYALEMIRYMLERETLLNGATAI